MAVVVIVAAAAVPHFLHHLSWGQVRFLSLLSSMAWVKTEK